SRTASSLESRPSTLESFKEHASTPALVPTQARQEPQTQKAAAESASVDDSHFRPGNTSELAADLCEQLRLVLEPTLATKLRGDYRTGRRLNMRKILGYIASNYRRDKIWLRRTSPCQRAYRVSLAIDCSQSMRELGCVKLASESLCLIAQALHKLEVGELA